MQTAQRSIASLFIFLILLAGIALLFLFSVGMALTSFLPLLTGGTLRADGLIYGFAFGFEALLLTVAAYFVFQKYQLKDAAEQPVGITLRGWHVAALIVSTGAALGLGYLVSEVSAVNWLVLPVLTIPAVALPVLLLFSLGARRLPLGPRWQAWSIFGLGMTVGPVLLIVVEVFILIVIIVLVSIYLASQPELMTELRPLANRLSLLQGDPEAVLDLLSPYLVRPGVIYIVLAFFAVIVPFTEELLKPIGVWLFAVKLDSPAQGFALGALSGGAFGLIETFGSSGQTTGWTELLVTRIGTALLHVTCSALMGWGIASAWKERRFLRLFGMYLGASALHGVWNASVLMISFSALAGEMDVLNPLGRLGPWMLVITLAVGILLGIILLGMNHRLSKSVTNETIEKTLSTTKDTEYTKEF